MSVRRRAPGAPASVIEQDGREVGPDPHARARVGIATIPGKNGGMLLSGGKAGRRGPNVLARKRQAIQSAMLRAITSGDVAAVIQQLVADATSAKVSAKDRSTAARVLFDTLGKPSLQERIEAGVTDPGHGPTVFIFDHDPVAIKV